MKPRRDSNRLKLLNTTLSSLHIAGDTHPRPVNWRNFFSIYMAGQSRKWMILVATIWIQAFTGTNFDFSAYSSEFKSVLGVSQVQLNYLAVASDLGKALGWSSGLALMYLPLWVVMFISAFMGLFGYGLQWLVISKFISLPYFSILSLSTISWIFLNWGLFFLLFFFLFFSIGISAA